MFFKNIQPKTALYELTLKCNMNCIHCGSSAGKKRNKELTTSEWNEVTKQLANLKFKQITLLGGEPFLKKDWYEIAKKIKDTGLEVSIISNGLLINKKIIEKLKKIEPYVVGISLDGAKPETQDYIRGIKGSFEKCINVLKDLKEANIATSVITTINKLNFKDLPEIRSMLLNKGIAWQLQIAIPVGRFKKELMLSKEEFYASGFFIAATQKSYSFKELPIIGSHCFGYFSKKLPNVMIFPWSGCQAGISTIGIQSNGDVKGCLSLPSEFIEGNVKKNALEEILNNPDFCSYTRKFDVANLNSNCRQCKYVKKCKGGCVGTAYGINGKSNGDPYCFRLIENSEG